MPSTSGWSFPYPALTNTPNVPADLQALATDIDAKLSDFAAGTRAADIVANATTFTALVNPTATVQNGTTTVTSNRLTSGRTGLYEVCIDQNYSHTAAVQVNIVARLNSGGSATGGSQLFAVFDVIGSAGGNSAMTARRRGITLGVGDYIEFFFTAVSSTTGCTLKSSSVHSEYSLKLLDPA